MRTALLLMGLTCLGAAGCVGLPHTADRDGDAPAASRPSQTWPVTADQIDEKNAHAMTQTLLDEIDREELRTHATPPVPAPPAKDKK
jgi:hypothetical protein